jgi:hypothetical protein
LESHFPAYTYLKENSKACRYYFEVMGNMQLTYPVEKEGKGLIWMFPIDSPLQMGIRMDKGYNPIVLRSTSEIQKLPGKTYMRLMAIRGFLFGRDQGESPEFTRRSFDNNFLYELKDPPPYLNAPSQITVIPGDTERLAAMGNKDFNPADQAFLSESLPASLASQLDGKKAQLKYDLTLDEPDHQAFQVQLDRNSMVTFSEIVYPGWHASLDGQTVPLFTANHVFRAVYVPAGSHQVDFIFQPSWAKPFLIAFLLWLFSAIAFGAYVWKQKGRNKVEIPQS